MYFATLLDRNYIPRADVMIDSLASQMGERLSKVFVLSLDDQVVAHFSENPNVTCVPLTALEDFFPELGLAKRNRSKVEYIFTLSPFFPLYLLLNFPELERITSLDSDLCFYASPKGVLDSLGEDKIGITAHNFPLELVHLEKYGKYNVSFQSFPKTELGMRCLQEWAEDCVGFCGDYLDEEGRFADQKYLDSWQERYGLVEVFPSPQIGLAPWNIHSYRLKFDSPTLTIDGVPVVFYHFQGLRIKSNSRFLLGLAAYMESKKPSASARKMYLYYIEKLIEKGNGVGDRIKRLQVSTASGFQAFVDDMRVQPALLKFGPFSKYVDLRKVVDFAERKLKITKWQN